MYYLYSSTTNDMELYEYAVYNLLLTIYPVVFAAIIGSLMGALKESIAIIFPFILIRKFSGGFHAKSTKVCMFISCLLLSLCIKLSEYLNCGIELAGVTILAILCLALFSPIDSENRRLDLKEKTSNKYVTVAILIFLSVICVMLYSIQQEIYVVCISISIILASGMQLPCIFRKIKCKTL